MGDTNDAIKFFLNPTLAVQTETIDQGVLQPTGNQTISETAENLNKAPGEDAAKAQDRLIAQRERERRKMKQKLRASLFKPQRRPTTTTAGTLNFGQIAPLEDPLSL